MCWRALVTGCGPGPANPASIADIVSEADGFEAECGGLEVSQRIFAGVGEISHGVIFDLGNGDECEITRAQQTHLVDRITPVGVHAGAGPLWESGKARRPSRLGLSWSDHERAKTHKVPHHRQRPGLWRLLAACARGDLCHMAASPWYSRRCPQQRELWRHRPPPWTLCGHLIRCTTC